MIPRDYQAIVDSFDRRPNPFQLSPGYRGRCRVRLYGRSNITEGEVRVSGHVCKHVLFAEPYLLLISPDGAGEHRQRFYLFEVIRDRFELVWAASLDFPGGCYEGSDEENFVNLLHPAEPSAELERRVAEEAEMRRSALEWLQHRGFPLPCALE